MGDQCLYRSTPRPGPSSLLRNRRDHERPSLGVGTVLRISRPQRMGTHRIRGLDDCPPRFVLSERASRHSATSRCERAAKAVHGRDPLRRAGVAPLVISGPSVRSLSISVYLSAFRTGSGPMQPHQPRPTRSRPFSEGRLPLSDSRQVSPERLLGCAPSTSAAASGRGSPLSEDARRPVPPVAEARQMHRRHDCAPSCSSIPK